MSSYVLSTIFSTLTTLLIFILSSILAIKVSTKLKKVFKQKFKKKSPAEIQQSTLNDNEIKRLSDFFVSTEEKYLSSLGNGYIMNFIANRSLKRGFAVISDKRVYFRGSCYSGQGKKLKQTEEERTVDIKDITGSGFIYQKYIGILVGLAAALAVLSIGTITSVVIFRNAQYEYKYNQEVAKSEQLSLETKQFGGRIWSYNDGDPHTETDEEVEQRVERQLAYHQKEAAKNRLVSVLTGVLTGICWTLTVACFLIYLDYLKKRKTFFQIQYAGGSIAFDVSFYAKAEIEDFQKQLRRAKDFSEKTVATKAVAVEPAIPTSSQSSAADDLRKYADLLKDGLISQEEYDALKKKVLDL